MIKLICAICIAVFWLIVVTLITITRPELYPCDPEKNTECPDSIPAKTGKNDGDRTSSDCISRQPEQRWIPCSERQPDKEGDYLVTLCDDGRTWVEIALWNETFGGSWQAILYNDVDYSDISNVIAWMPLPVIYQEGGEADE